MKKFFWSLGLLLLAGTSFAQSNTTIGGRLPTNPGVWSQYNITDDGSLSTKFGGATIPLFYDSFTGPNGAPDRWKQTNNNMIVSQHGGFATLDSGAVITDGANSNLRSWRSFPIFGTYPTVCEMRIAFNGQHDPQTEADWGLGNPAGSAPTPSTGAFFRLGQVNGVLGSNAGATAVRLYGIVSFATIEDTVQLKTNANLPTGFHRYRVEVNRARAEFYIDDVLAGFININKANPTPLSNIQAFAGLQVFNGVGVAQARLLQVSNVSVWSRDLTAGKPWGAVLSGMGNGSYQAPSGTIAGGNNPAYQTALWQNSTMAVTASSFNNTTANYSTLGGLYKILISGLSNNTDYPLFSYVVVLATDSIPGRTLHITGVRVGEMIVDSTAMANTTAYTYTWAIGVGGSAASLATNDNALDFASSSVSHRRIPLGSQSFPSATAGPTLGSIAPGFDVDFSAAPLMVPTGARATIILRAVQGAATAGVVLKGNITVKGYFE